MWWVLLILEQEIASTGCHGCGHKVLTPRLGTLRRMAWVTGHRGALVAARIAAFSWG